MVSMQALLAFSAGILSFLAPCMLPLYPVYLSRITGLSVQELKGGPQSKLRKIVLLNTILFVAGISVIYLALAFTTSIVGQFFVQYRNEIRLLSGTLMVLMGFFLIGLFQPKWLVKEQRFIETSKQSGNYITSFLIGLGFAAGWTPCVGPILSAIIGMSLTEPSKSLLYMLCYIAGFAVPFLVSALFLPKVMKLTKYTSVLNKVGGVFIIVVGVLMLTNKLGILSKSLNMFFDFVPFL